jgi:Phage protein (N4 Gp49/phage Sf6 gene 66) family
MTLESTEAECAAIAKAPRVSLADIEAAITERWDLDGEDAVSAVSGGEPRADWRHLSICLLRLKNGWMVVGKSAPASAANFNAELGCKLAYEDCIRQLWPLMGFALRDKLASQAEHAAGAPHLSTQSTELDRA